MGAITWAPGTIAAGASVVSPNVSISGLLFGDLMKAPAFTASLQGLSSSAYVSATGVANAVLANGTGAAVTIGSGTLVLVADKQ